MHRVLLAAIVLSLGGSAHATPTYPIRAPEVTAAETARRKAKFVAANPEKWLRLLVDARGFVVELETDEVSLVPSTDMFTDAELKQLRAWVRRNASFFNLDPADADRMTKGTVNGMAPGGRSPVGAELLDIDEVLIGRIRMVRTANATLVIHVTPWMNMTAKISEADALARVVGKSYKHTVVFRESPRLDCALNAHGTKREIQRAIAKCQQQHELGRISEEIKLAANHVSVSTRLIANRTTVRLVRRIEFVAQPHPTWGHGEHTVTPRGSAIALPTNIDAVTGEVVRGAGFSQLR